MSVLLEDYVINEDDTARFTLGKYVDNPLVVFGINPSTATIVKNDPTISIVERIAKKRGYDGYLMLNIYPVRATKIDRHFDKTCNEEVSNRNLEIISSRIHERSDIVAAWGTHIGDRDYFIRMLSEVNIIVKSKRANWVVLSITKKGHPHHPTRLAYEKMTFERFDMDAYINRFTK